MIQLQGRGVLRAVAMTFCTGVLAACASIPTAGTGDVAFRLLWEGQSDLDLHVLDPGDQHIFFGSRTSASGGILDVDCNGGTGRLCTRPIENVYWPEGAAPDGLYRFWVRTHSVIPVEAPIRARLLILDGDEVVEEHQGELLENGDLLGPFALTFDRHRGPGEIVPVGADEVPGPVHMLGPPGGVGGPSSG